MAKPLLITLGTAAALAATFFIHRVIAKPVNPTPTAHRLTEIRPRVGPDLAKALAKKDLKLGMPLFVRIFKESNELEVWLQPKHSEPWKFFKTYPILTYGGGTLGPKLKSGDKQAPEGFYHVGSDQLNPNSSYHLSFNVGYPNAYDKAWERTGSLIMVHGKNASIGCFAMGDPAIEEIYLLAESALVGGQQKFAVHAFPFRMTPKRLKQAETERSPWLGFWVNELLPGFTAFENTKQVPRISVQQKSYRIVGP